MPSAAAFFGLGEYSGLANSTFEGSLGMMVSFP
jgi:hypothetical protein